MPNLATTNTNNKGTNTNVTVKTKQDFLINTVNLTSSNNISIIFLQAASSSFAYKLKMCYFEQGLIVI